MGWLFCGVVSCGSPPFPGREFPRDVDAVRDADPLVSCDPPTLEETRRAVNQLKSGKAPGGCGIYDEMLRAGEAAALLWLHTFMFQLEHENHPDRLKTGRCRSYLEGKGDTQECNNYMGLPSSLCQARSWHEFSSIESGKSC